MRLGAVRIHGLCFCACVTFFFVSGALAYIAQGEPVGALAPYLLVSALRRGRPIVQLQDNTGALSALLHGCALKPHMGRVVSVFPSGAVCAARACVA